MVCVSGKLEVRSDRTNLAIWRALSAVCAGVPVGRVGRCVSKDNTQWQLESEYWLPVALDLSVPIYANVWSRTDTTCCASITILPAPKTTLPTYSTRQTSNLCATMSRFPSMSRSTKSTTWPARHRRSIINGIRFRRPKPVSMAPSTCWAWRSEHRPKYFRLRGLWRPGRPSAK